MIYWLMLALAVLSNSAKGYCSKKLSGVAGGMFDNVMINLYRGIICVAVGAVIMLATGKSFAISGTELFYCFIAGAAMTAFQLSWLLALRGGAYMMVSAFSSASFVIPCLCGFVFLKESVTLPKAAAIAVISVAIFFLCLYNNKTKAKLSLGAFAVLLVVCVSQGINQIFQKLYNSVAGGESVAAYNFYMFVFLTVFTSVLGIIFKPKGNVAKAAVPRFSKLAWGLIIISSVGIYAANFFQTYAAKGLDASVMYPVLNGLSVCSGTTMSILLFGEKPKKESVIGILLVFTALILNTAF